MRLTLALAATAAVVAGCSAGGTGDLRAPVQRYLHALGRGDAGAACREFTAHSREQLAEFGAEHLKTPKSCAAVVGALMANPAGARLKALGSAAILHVEAHGETGEVRVRGLARPIDVARQDGRWRIRSAPTGEVD